MEIKDMFAKPIDRDLQGVIKVGDIENENIRQELEEYVVTKELQKHFADFFCCLQERNQRDDAEDGRLDFRLLWQW